MGAKKRLIIDTDAGIDDAQAILMALNSPEVEVVAITTCHGNTDADQVCRNVLRLLKVAGRLDIPVYRGCSKPLLGHTASAAHYHGMDGFGDVPDPDAPDISLAQTEHAVSAMVRLISENAGELTLVALGPCTNIAIALRMKPELGRSLKDCYMMGGNYEGKGNITPSAEFNFYADPEAAQVVLRELGAPLYLVCWELCVKHSLPWDFYTKMRGIQTPANQFLNTIEKNATKTVLDRGDTTYVPCDELVMAAAIKGSDIIINKMTCYATVESHGVVTRGQMVVDWRKKLGLEPNVIIISELKMEIYKQLLMEVASRSRTN